MPRLSSVRYPLPHNKVIKAQLLLELEKDTDKIYRVGGVMPKELNIESSFVPEVKIDIK